MAIKTVYGYHQGDTNKVCKLVESTPIGNLWLIVTEMMSALEHTDGKLYRLAYVGEMVFEDAERVHRVREQATSNITNMCQDGSLMTQIKANVDHIELLSESRLAATIAHPNERSFITQFDPAQFVLAGRVEADWLAVKLRNDTIRQHNSKVAKEYSDRQTAINEKYKKERRDKLIAKVLADEKIEAQEFIELADDYGVTIALRTRGWVMNNLSTINSSSYSWHKTKKGQRPSEKALDYYKLVREAVIQHNQK